MDLLNSLTAHTESWIDVSSQPSSSSLSSAATDEVVTTGLRVAQAPSGRRRRRLHQPTETSDQKRAANDTAGNSESSQEEYDDSESESDRALTSSNEDINPQFSKEDDSNQGPSTISSSIHSDGISFDSAEDDDDDGNATAIGVVDPTPFTPQPHAFSHPPSARLTQTSNTSQDSYFPSLPLSTGTSSRQTQTNRTSIASPSSAPRPHARTHSHTPYNVISPNHTLAVDHDAALRASLSTLLSCAAAARGLPKREGTQGPVSTQNRPALVQRSRQASRVEPGTLRMIPESALTKVEESAPVLPRRPSTSSPGSPRSPEPGPPKRKAKSPGRDRRKKHRSGTYTSNDDIVNISPTLTTWVVGAGVLVLFSAISFSAGYALGKEVGRVDALGSGAGFGCANEAEGSLGRGIVRSRAWRWGNTGGVRA